MSLCIGLWCSVKINVKALGNECVCNYVHMYITLYNLGWNSVIQLNILRAIIKCALYCLDAKTVTYVLQFKMNTQ